MTNRWLQTNSGLAFDLLHPTPDMIVFNPDVFWSLSKQDRYNGHAREFIPIAEHSIRVSVIASAVYGARFRRPGLGHDFPESITGDVPSPIIRILNETKTPDGRGAWAAFCEPIERAFAERMDLDLLDLPPEVRRADVLALMIEKEACHAPSPRPPGDGWPVVEAAEIAEAQKAWFAWCRSGVDGVGYQPFGWSIPTARYALTREARSEGWV